jgi:hypothetical protein
MKKKTWFLVIASVIGIVLFQSCYYDKADLLYPGAAGACDTSVVAKFSSEVLPVMTANCNSGGCHNTASAAGAVILDTYAGVKTQALNGRLIGSTDHINGTMPKGGAKLTNCTIAKMQQWINSGSPNN